MFDYDELTYTDILLNLEEVEDEVNNLDDDSLIDEVGSIQYNIDGKESEKVQRLVFKNHANEEFTKDEVKFLQNVYVVYYAAFALLIDEGSEDEV